MSCFVPRARDLTLVRTARVGFNPTMEPKKRQRAVLFVALVLPLVAGTMGLWHVLRLRTTPTSLPPLSNADASYTLRGIIDTLPQATGPDKYIKIHHESLPEFRNKKGEVVGMHEMIMDFEQVDPSVPLHEFKVGDAVEFTFEVRWDPRVVTRVVKVRKLPRGTTLALQKAREGSSRAD